MTTYLLEDLSKLMESAFLELLKVAIRKAKKPISARYNTEMNYIYSFHNSSLGWDNERLLSFKASVRVVKPSPALMSRTCNITDPAEKKIEYGLDFGSFVSKIIDAPKTDNSKKIKSCVCNMHYGDIYKILEKIGEDKKRIFKI